MSRTFRRKQERHEYYWALHDWESKAPFGQWVPLDPHSKAGRKALARFHADNGKAVTVGGSAPRRYRKASDHKLRTSNDRMMRRWLANPAFDPVFRAWHRHDANWNWW